MYIGLRFKLYDRARLYGEGRSRKDYDVAFQRDIATPGNIANYGKVVKGCEGYIPFFIFVTIIVFVADVIPSFVKWAKSGLVRFGESGNIGKHLNKRNWNFT